MHQGRIGGLRKSRKPLGVPRIKPVLRVMGGKELMKVGVVGVIGELHEQQRAVDRQRQQQDPSHRNRPAQYGNISAWGDHWGTHENLRSSQCVKWGC